MSHNTIKSPFAEALEGLLLATGIYARRDWAKLLGIKESAISQWLSEETIPRASNLGMIYITVEKASDAKKGPLEVFRRVAQLPALEASPKNGKRMLPTVWEYMTRPLFDELSNKLAKLSPAEQEKLLEERFLVGPEVRTRHSSEPIADASQGSPSRLVPDSVTEIAAASRAVSDWGSSKSRVPRQYLWRSSLFDETQNASFIREHQSRVSDSYIIPTFRRLSDGDDGDPIGAPVGLDQLSKDATQFLLVGAAGTGKTSLAKHIFHELNDKASALSQSWRGRTPIYVQLHRLPAVESSNDLRNVLSAMCSGSLDGALVLLDGFDEVLLERREGLVRGISGLNDSSPQTGMIITSRPTPDLRSLRPITRYCLQLPAESRLLALACNRVATAVTDLSGWDDAFLHANSCFRERPDVFRALGTPLLLSYAASLFAGTSLNPCREVDLLDSCLTFLFERWDEEKNVVRSRSIWTSKNSRLLYQWLGGICYHSLLHQVFDFTREHIAQWCSKSVDRVPIEADLKAIGEATGVIVPSGGTRWTIVHKTICEYLAARYIVESSGDATGYLKGDHSPWMSNVLRFASSITHDAGPLLMFVLESSWDSRTEKMATLAGMLSQDTRASDEVLDRSCDALVGLLEESFANWRLVTSEEESEVFPEPKWRLAARTDRPSRFGTTGAAKHMLQTIQALHRARLSLTRPRLAKRLSHSANEVVRGCGESLNVEGYMEGRSFSRNESQLFAAEICEI